MNNRSSAFPFLAVMLTTFTCGFLFAFLPVSETVRVWRPNLVALVLIFWLIRTPEHIGVGTAWLIGLLYDGTTGCYLGQHALAFSFIAYLVLITHQGIRVFGLLQQVVVIFMLLLLDQMADSWFAAVIRGDETHYNFFISAALGALCWPVMMRWLTRYQH